jgi:hypothetical protein
MKNNRSVTTGVVIITVLAVIVIATSLLNIRPPQPQIPTAANTLPPTLTNTPDPCSEENLQVLVPIFNRNSRAFDDLSVIAQNTPREQLVPIVSQLQEIRRAAEDYAVPSCMSKAKEYQLAYMNTFIDTLLALYSSLTSKLTDQDVNLINQGMGLAIQYHDQYMIETARLLGVTLPAPPTAISTLEGTTTPAALQ